MAGKFVTSERDGAVLTVSIARPDRLNALTPAVFEQLTAAIDEGLAAGVRALVLSGEGRFFCSGADIRSDGEGYFGLPQDLGELIDAHYNPFTRKLMDLPIPVITAINGPAVGAGLSIALAGDVSIMAKSGFALLAFVNIGLVPDAGATWLAARAVGRTRAMELALLGEQMSAEEAVRIGLVTRMAEDDKVLAEAQAIAHRLAKGPARAIGMIRKQVNEALDMDFDEVLDRERDNQRILGRTEDFREALTAFGQKRRPNFKGR